MDTPRTRTRRTRGETQPTETVANEVLTVRATAVGLEEERQEVIQVCRFASEPAYVRVNAGVTKNMGNYESLRIDVSLSMPCYPEEIDTVMPKVAEKVAVFLDTEVANYQNA